MKVELLVSSGKKKAGDVVTCSDRWGKYALSAGLAKMPEKKSKKTETAEKPATEKE